jgi:hypothetical protein
MQGERREIIMAGEAGQTDVQRRLRREPLG